MAAHVAGYALILLASPVAAADLNGFDSGPPSAQAENVAAREAFLFELRAGVKGAGKARPDHEDRFGLALGQIDAFAVMAASADESHPFSAFEPAQSFARRRTVAIADGRKSHLGREGHTLLPFFGV